MAAYRPPFDDLADEIEDLRTDKEALLLEDANRQGVKQRLDELEAFLEEQQEPVTDYDEGLVRRLIERITVYDDRLVVARHTEIGANGKQFFHYNAEQTAQSAPMQHVFIGEAA